MDFFKSPFGKFILVVIIIVVLYYILSPYQNCMRDLDIAKAFCIRNTTW